MASRRLRARRVWWWFGASLLLVSLDANAAVGRFQFVAGQVQVTPPGGSPRAVGKGDEVNPGDLVATASNAAAQLRMVDGALLAVRAGTQLRIDEYQYSGKADGSERSFFSLVAGTFRSITGAIGKLNRDAYRVRTTTATIGIRGSDADIGFDPGSQLTAVRTYRGSHTITAPDAGGRDTTLVTQPGQIAVVLPGQAPSFSRNFPFETPAPKPGADDGGKGRDRGKAGSADKPDDKGGKQRPDSSAENGQKSGKDEPAGPGANGRSGGEGASGDQQKPLGERAQGLAEDRRGPLPGDRRDGRPTGPGGAPLAGLPGGVGGTLDGPRTGTGDQVHIPIQSGSLDLNATSARLGAVGVGADIELESSGLFAGNGSLVVDGSVGRLVLLAPNGALVGVADPNPRGGFRFSAGTAVLNGYRIFSETSSIGVSFSGNWGVWLGGFSVFDEGEPKRSVGGFAFATSPQVTTVLPIVGVANYSFIGGTATNELGQLPTALNASATVNFGSAQVTAMAVSASFPNGQSWSGSGSGPIANFITNNGSGISLTGSCTGGNCGGAASGEAHGQFVADRAAGMLMGFSLTTTGQQQAVSGVAALKR